MNKIPKYVQAFEKLNPEDDLKSHLIKAYNLDGVNIDNEMIEKNPNSKKYIPFISVTSVMINKTKSKLDVSHQELMDNWIYCGNRWYVRKNDDIYEFAKYMAYNTETKTVEDDWDQKKYA